MATIDREFDFQERALTVRGYRQQLLSSNIANADTPNYKAVDIDFAKALQSAQAGQSSVSLAKTSPLHLDGKNSAMADIKPMYRTAAQPSIDGNTVDANVEQSQFSENAIKYLATLQFINGKIQSTMAALKA